MLYGAKSYSVSNNLQNNVEKFFNKKLFNIIQHLWKLNSHKKAGGKKLSSCPDITNQTIQIMLNSSLLETYMPSSIFSNNCKTCLSASYFTCCNSFSGICKECHKRNHNFLCNRITDFNYNWAFILSQLKRCYLSSVISFIFTTDNRICHFFREYTPVFISDEMINPVI